MSAGGGLTSGSGQHVREALPGRHHLRVLLIGKVLPDSQRSVVWNKRRGGGGEGGRRRESEPGWRADKRCSEELRPARRPDTDLKQSMIICRTHNDLSMNTLLLLLLKNQT